MPGARGDTLDRTFFWSLVAKGVSGVSELVGGIALLVLTPQAIHALVARVTTAELAEDPRDAFANLLVHHTANVSWATLHFGAAYLLVHGVVKVVLVAAVLRDRLWAYPWLIGTLGAFIAYQLFEISRRPTVGMVLLTLFDVVVVGLTVHEYRRKRARRDEARACGR